MTNSKYIFDSWFDDLYEDLAWEQACEEQDNYDKAVDLAMSFLTPSEVPSRKWKRKRFFLSRDFNSRKFPGVFQGSGETFECFGDEKDKRS